MVFHDTVVRKSADPNYENELFRARHGYKELHQHNPPERRNRDFKPVTYGSWRGMLNFKHAEPWCQLKNLEDLANETHHHPIKWFKQFVLGASMGTLFGLCWFLIKPQQGFTMRKLFASAGERPWSGRHFR